MRPEWERDRRARLHDGRASRWRAERAERATGGAASEGNNVILGTRSTNRARWIIRAGWHHVIAARHRVQIRPGLGRPGRGPRSRCGRRGSASTLSTIQVEKVVSPAHDAHGHARGRIRRGVRRADRRRRVRARVQAVGRIRYDALVPCWPRRWSAISSCAGSACTTPLPQLGHVGIDLVLLGKVALAGLAVLARPLRRADPRPQAPPRLVPWVPARPVLGGVIVILLTLAVGNQTYNGLSLGLIGDSRRYREQLVMVAEVVFWQSRGARVPRWTR